MEKNLSRETRNGATIQDDRSGEEIRQTAGFLTAHDPSMSHWGNVARSLVAVPIKTDPEGGHDAMDEKAKRERFEHNRYRYINWQPSDWRPRGLRSGDHLHIYGMGDFLFSINYQRA